MPSNAIKLLVPFHQPLHLPFPFPFPFQFLFLLQ
jgi:hypothetical protein